MMLQLAKAMAQFEVDFVKKSASLEKEQKESLNKVIKSVR
jgi:hypothetical protein